MKMLWYSSTVGVLLFREEQSYLEIETVEEFGDEGERREKDLQDVHICGMSLTQVDRSLRQRR